MQPTKWRQTTDLSKLIHSKTWLVFHAAYFVSSSIALRDETKTASPAVQDLMKGFSRPLFCFESISKMVGVWMFPRASFITSIKCYWIKNIKPQTNCCVFLRRTWLLWRWFFWNPHWKCVACKTCGARSNDRWLLTFLFRYFFIIYYLFIYIFIYFKPLLFFFEQNNFKNRGYLGFEPVTLVSMFISLPFMTKFWQLQPLTHKNRN